MGLSRAAEQSARCSRFHEVSATTRATRLPNRQAVDAAQVVAPASDRLALSMVGRSAGDVEAVVDPDRHSGFGVGGERAARGSDPFGLQAPSLMLGSPEQLIEIC